MGRIRRKYTEEMLTEVVARSTSVADVLRRLGLNQAGGTHAHLSRTIKAFGIDTSHFGQTPHSNGSDKRRRTPDQILVRLAIGSRRQKPHMLQRALIESGRRYECAICRIGSTWCGRELKLEIDHIDGDYHNNEGWNLRFLCPNCHAQTDTFAGRSKNKYVMAGGQLALFGTVMPTPVTDT